LALQMALGDAQQRILFNHLGYGVVWIMPHSQEVICYTPSETCEYVALVLWTDTHCEPLTLMVCYAHRTHHLATPATHDRPSPIRGAIRLQACGRRWLRRRHSIGRTPATRVPTAGGEPTAPNIADLDESPVLVTNDTDEPLMGPSPPLGPLSTPPGIAPRHTAMTARRLHARRRTPRITIDADGISTSL